MRETILKEFRQHKKLKMADLTKKFNISRQAIHRHLQPLLHERAILKFGSSRSTTVYLLNDPKIWQSLEKKESVFHKRYRREGLSEEAVYQELSRWPGLLSRLSENARSLFQYGFTEMLNNAIDHSQSKFVVVVVKAIPQQIFFEIGDLGIGVFENIRSKKKLQNEMEALQDLLKGKQTTFPEAHSGEGIFFTSKIADRFRLLSHHKSLLIDNQINDLFVEDIRFRKGTRVWFELNNQSTQQLSKLFKNYTSEEFKFDKSYVVVKLFKEKGGHISRSEAKRLLHSLEKFEKIVLDFKGVQTVGQGFADEVFRVYANQHPKIELIPIHCNENVQFMIERATRA